MAKDPAFLFYSSDFLVGVYLMTDAQRGQYITLLCLQHQQGHLSEEVMLSVMGGAFDEMVACKFLVDENRLYYNERLDAEVNRRKDYSASRTKNRMSKTSETHVEDMSNICETHVEHMETETIYTNNTDNKPDKPITNTVSIPKRFDALWNLYPCKKGKKEAFASYERDIRNEVETDDVDGAIRRGIEAYIAYIKVEKIKPQFIKHGSTFFNQRAWEDDYEYGKDIQGNAIQGDKPGQRVSQFAYLDTSI